MIEYQILKRFCIFLPAMARIEEYCIRKAIEPQKYVLDFIGYITPREGKDELAGEQLDELKSIGVSFVESTYATGKSIRRWSKGLFDDYFWRQEIAKNKNAARGEFTKVLRDREAFYVLQAERYASSHALKT